MDQDTKGNQGAAPDAKLKELEKELSDLGQKARHEIQSQPANEAPATQTQPQAPAPQPADRPPQAPTQPAQKKETPPTPPPQTPQETGGKSKVVLWIALAILFLAIVAGGGYYFIFLKGGRQVSTPSQATPPPATPGPTASWMTYQSSEHQFSLMHPPEISPEAIEDGIVYLSLWGPTQREDTEFYDGISLSFNSGSLEGEDLRSFVDAKLAEMRETAEIKEEVQETTLDSLSGYKFTAEGLGVFTYYYLQRGEDSYLEIVDGTVDPTGEGFAEVVELILSSLELISVATPSPSPSPTGTPSATTY